MFWLPRPTGEFPLTPFLVVLGILAICLAILWWERRRKRNDPDRGGPGYTAVPDVYVPSAPPADPNPLGAEERWLLGFAAPRVVHEGFDPTRWDLGPHALEPPASGWRERRIRLEAELDRAASPADRAVAAVELAWWIRLGVATRQVTETTARDDTRSLAESMRRDADDWLAFGDLLGDRQGMSRPRDLYRPGAPWADPQWPR